MITRELRESATELNVIFNNCSIEVLDKIPNKFRKFVEEIASDTYEFKYDATKKLNEQNLKPKTRKIIMLIYRDYLCSGKEREEYITELEKKIRQKEEEKRKKYNPNELFKRRSKKNIETQEENKSINMNFPTQTEDVCTKKIWNITKEIIKKIIKKIIKNK